MGMEEELKQVIELITRWVSKIKINNCIRFFDINQVAEDLVLKQLNEIYNLQLVNLNREKANYAGIDLGDKINKIAFQVTSRNDSKKIEKSLQSFVKKDKNTFPNGIRFFLLNEKKPGLKGKKWQSIDADFHPKDHIINYLDLIKKIKDLYTHDPEKFNKIKEILIEEIEVKGLKDVKPIKKGKQIKILSMTASPDDVDDIYYEMEQDTMLEAFKTFDREEVYLDMPDPVKHTLIEIQENLENGKHDILHITAHGSIDSQGQGILCLEDQLGKLDEVTGKELVKYLVPAPKIVILSACHSAQPEPDLMPVARSLFEQGIDVVIGMKTRISHAAAIEFNVAFFRALCQNNPVKTAFEQGKEAIFKGEQKRLKEIPGWEAQKEYEIPLLLAREKDENLTREDFSLHRINVPDRPESHHFKGAKYLDRGFIGRRQVLREIYKAIHNREGAIVLKGPGGIGKSTLTTRAAANLRSQAYDFIVVKGETTVEQIMEAICIKATEKEIKGAREVFAAEAAVEDKLSWFLDNFLLKHKIVIIFDNFEENQDEEKKDFSRPRLKEFLWYFRDALKGKDTVLFFSTRYTLPGFDKWPAITLEILEFSAVEFRKILGNSKALKRLDSQSIKNLRQEIGGNPRALELLDQITYKEFNEREFTWQQLKEVFPELQERIIQKKGTDDDFTPLFLDKLFGYLTGSQRQVLDILSIYRNPVPIAAISIHNVKMERPDRIRLADLSLLECSETERERLYYLHRLTARYLLTKLANPVKTKYHLEAAGYFAGIKNEKGETYLENEIEARWHYLQAGEWDQAALITFGLENYLTLHGFPQWSMELLQELEVDQLNEENQLITYGQIGNLYYHFGKYEQSIEYYHKAYELAQKNNDLKSSARVLHQVGMIYEEKGDYDAALKQYEKSLEIKENIGDSKGVSYSLHQIGMIYQQKGDYDAALKQYEKSLEIDKKIGDSKGVSSSLHQIGMIYQDKGDYDAALKQYEKSLEIDNKIGDIKGVSYCLHQIGNVYYLKGDYDAALNQYEKSLEIKEKIGDIKGVSDSLHQVGMIYQEKGDYDAALKQYEKSLEIREKIGDIPGIALSMGQTGKLYIQKKEPETALPFFIRALLVFTKIGSPYANLAVKDIAGVRNILPKAQFDAILKEFNLDPEQFQPPQEPQKENPIS